MKPISIAWLRNLFRDQQRLQGKSNRISQVLEERTEHGPSLSVDPFTLFGGPTKRRSLRVKEGCLSIISPLLYDSRCANYTHLRKSKVCRHFRSGPDYHHIKSCQVLQFLMQIFFIVCLAKTSTTNYCACLSREMNYQSAFNFCPDIVVQRVHVMTAYGQWILFAGNYNY